MYRLDKGPDPLLSEPALIQVHAMTTKTDEKADALPTCMHQRSDPLG